MRILNSRLIYVVRLAVLTGAVFLLFSCATTFDYTAFKESRPHSILVMPPVNQSLDVNGPLTYLSTSTHPLAESGYYVIPVTVADQMFKQNGVTVAEEALAIDYRRLHEIFGADSALYITITRYGAKFIVIDSTVEAEASARLIDLRTGQELWSGKAYAQGSNNVRVGSGGLFSLIASAAISQAVNALSDKAFDVGRNANYTMLSAGKKNSILYGPYHPKYQTD